VPKSDQFAGRNCLVTDTLRQGWGDRPTGCFGDAKRFYETLKS
jgi:hypothetical protein